MDIWVIYEVIRDFKGYVRGLAPKMVLFFIAKIASIPDALSCIWYDKLLDLEIEMSLLLFTVISHLF